MIRKLSILILALIMSAGAIASSKRKIEDDDIGQEAKRAFLSESEEKEDVEVSIDLSAGYRKDKVVQLSLAFNPYLDNVNFLLGFPHLTDLDLTACYKLGDNYGVISQLTNLERLSLFNTNLTTTVYLRPLVKLQHLRIICPNLEESMVDLSCLKSLKELDISGRCWKGLIGLSQLTSLESLILRSFYLTGEEEFEEEFPPLDFLSPLLKLRELDLSSNTFITHIKPIVNLPNLTALNLRGCQSIFDLRCLKKLKSLKDLNISNIGAYDIPTMEEDLIYFVRLNNLRKLTVISDIKVPDALSSIVKVIRD